MRKILLLEDDDSLGATLQERLVRESYIVDWAKSFQEAKKYFTEKFYDIAVLDVNLQDGNGFDFASSIKKISNTPFIFITAMAGAEYRLEGYELGAAEYIPKPFHLKELLLRIKHVLEDHNIESTVRVGNLTIDLAQMAIFYPNGNKESLTTKDNQVLRLLIHSSPKVVSRDQILESVWGEDKFPTPRTVDNSILRIRQLLGEFGNHCIRTVRGTGYQFSKGDFS